ncbi:hypothetical protein, partial [Amycolatopsis sp. SID8362]|uniref:hypothetical protein n=1 Tax=Amycolatopsis sp. SID8362 TaxID=2690346 RepID=UPI0013712380
PVWTEPARPDTSGLVAARSKAVTRVIWRLALLVVAAFAFTTYQLVIERQVSRYGSAAHQVYTVVLLVIAGLLALSVIRAVAGVRFAGRNIRNFEQPYRALCSSEQARYRQAVAAWEQVVRQHAAAAAEATREAAAAANGPQWFPV